MKIVDHPEFLSSLRPISKEDPLRILMSGCMLGMACGVDGTDYGFGKPFASFVKLPTVRVSGFCPEDFRMGTPRTWPDLHGGDGMDVLDGQAHVLDEYGADLTEAMLTGANAMVDRAREVGAELCLLMDMSAACGTQVISKGCRFDEERHYQQGLGVAAAALVRAGFWVMSQRDYKSFDQLMSLVDAGYEHKPGLLDHHEHPWTLSYFD